jgi:hypothetical protein
MSAPLTNRSGGENEIEVSYRTYGEFLELAQRVSEGAAGPSFDSHMIPMFCVALKRQCWDRVGPLDEQYQLGLFEDDDYCLRVKTAGFRMVVASQCFIHHFGQASMGSADHYAGLFRANRARYERKWGITWERAPRRRSADYLDMIGRLRTMVGHDVPQQVKVAVISRGDEELLKLGNCLTEHFMQDAEGRYAGHHPAHDLEALNRLEELRRRDVKYLLIPKTAFWWLEFYPDFRAHLATSCRLVAQQSGAGLLYQLPPIPNEPNS